VSTSITPGASQPEIRRATTFGMRLKQEREQRGITLDQISQSTKIGTRFLQALEQDHFEQLPGGIFNKGFVRAYARFVGIDEEQVVADFLTATGANQPNTPADDKPPAIELPPEPKRDRAPSVPWGILATLLLITAFSFAVWGFYSRVTSTKTQPPVPSAPLTETVIHTEASPAPQSVHPANEVKSSARANVVPSSATRTTSGASSSPTNASSSTSTPESGIPHEIVLRIKAREGAWVSINVDGEVTTQETLAALSEKTIRARQQIIVKAGNVGALDLEFRGKSLPVQGKVGEVKTLVFDANGWHALPKPVPSPPPADQP
jgi:cytoskeleton protein RodZ